jgi:hypothetical protein
LLTSFLGSSACVVAAIRLPFARRVGGTVDPSCELLTPNDYETRICTDLLGDMIAGGLLTVVEVAVALLCASLPVYRPLFKRFAPGLSSATTSGYKNRSSGPSDYLGSGGGVKTHVSTNSKRGNSYRPGINITDDISMTAHLYVNGEWERVADDEVGLFPKDTHSTPTGNNSAWM